MTPTCEQCGDHQAVAGVFIDGVEQHVCADCLLDATDADEWDATDDWNPETTIDPHGRL